MRSDVARHFKSKVQSSVKIPHLHDKSKQQPQSKKNEPLKTLPPLAFPYIGIVHQSQRLNQRSNILYSLQKKIEDSPKKKVVQERIRNSS